MIQRFFLAIVLGSLAIGAATAQVYDPNGIPYVHPVTPSPTATPTASPTPTPVPTCSPFALPCVAVTGIPTPQGTPTGGLYTVLEPSVASSPFTLSTACSTPTTPTSCASTSYAIFSMGAGASGYSYQINAPNGATLSFYNSNDGLFFFPSNLSVAGGVPSAETVASSTSTAGKFSGSASESAYVAIVMTTAGTGAVAVTPYLSSHVSRVSIGSSIGLTATVNPAPSATFLTHNDGSFLSPSSLATDSLSRLIISPSSAPSVQTVSCAVSGCPTPQPLATDALGRLVVSPSSLPSVQAVSIASLPPGSVASSVPIVPGSISGSCTVASTGAPCVVPMYGHNSLCFTTTGTWTATMAVKGDVGAGTYPWTATIYPVGGTGSSSYTSWTANSSGCTQVLGDMLNEEFVDTAYTSGTTTVYYTLATIHSGSAQAPGISSIVNGYSTGGVAVGQANADGQSANNNGLSTLTDALTYNGTSWDRNAYCGSSVSIAISSATTTQLVALSGATKIRVCNYQFSVAGTAPTYQFEYGTGTTCGTGTTAISGAIAPPSGTVVNSSAGGNMNIAFIVPPGDALCLVSGGTSPSIQGWLSYVQF